MSNALIKRVRKPISISVCCE